MWVRCDCERDRLSGAAIGCSWDSSAKADLAIIHGNDRPLPQTSECVPHSVVRRKSLQIDFRGSQLSDQLLERGGEARKILLHLAHSLAEFFHIH